MHDAEMVVGPYKLGHGLREPERFVFYVRAGKVRGARVNLGYNHRAIEKIAESKTYFQIVPFIERICGICNNAHSSCFCYAVEKLADVKIPERAGYLRTLGTELERAQDHLMWFAVLAEHLGDRGLFLEFVERRESFMDAFELFTGNRVQHALNLVGGVKWDLSKSAGFAVLKAIEGLEALLPKVDRKLRKEGGRLKGIGVLGKESARKFCVVGPVARGSGIDVDIRRDMPYGAYSDFEFDVPVEDGGDCLARTNVRMREIYESIGIIRQLIEGLPGGDISVKWGGKQPEVKLPWGGGIAKGEAIAYVEAPRGENMHYVVSDGSNKPYRLRIRPPSYANFSCLNEIVEGEKPGDALTVLLSLDPCFSCLDRVAFVKMEKRGGDVSK